MLEEGNLGSRARHLGDRKHTLWLSVQWEWVDRNVLWGACGAGAVPPSPEKSEKLLRRGLCWGRGGEEVAWCLGWWFRQGGPHWVVPSPFIVLPDCCLWSRDWTGTACWWVYTLSVWWGNLLWVFQCYLHSIPRNITHSRNLCVLYFVFFFSFMLQKHLLKQLPGIWIKKKKTTKTEKAKG